MKTLPILFTYEDFKETYPKITGFYSFLNRSLKNGNIKQIKKGLYALVDPSTGCVYANKFQIASKLFEKSYFSYHEALEYYGLATQSHVSSFMYIAHIRTYPIEFENVTYNSKANTCDLEIKDCIEENGVRVVSLERAIVDSIDNFHLAGGLDEVEEALKACPKLNIDKVVVLLEHYNKNFLYQKIGYLFEKYYGDLISSSFYELCLSKIGNKKTYLDCIPGKAVLIPKWHLLVKKY